MDERQTGAQLTPVRTQEKGTKSSLLSIRSQEGEKIAYNRLSPGALKIYLNVTANANGFHFPMTSNKLTQQCGISKRTYTRAVKELIDEGFLVKRDDGSEEWEFHDKPEVQEVYSVTVVKAEEQFHF